MAQRDYVTIAGGVVVGVVLGAVLGIGFLGKDVFGNTNTEVTLSMVDGACTLGKATQIRMHKGKQLKWEIENYCPEATRTVTVGNFRTTSAASAAGDCQAAGPDYPFDDAALAARTGTLEPARPKSNGGVDPSEGRIQLQAKSRDDLGEDELIYYFDICLDGAKADPMLVFER